MTTYAICYDITPNRATVSHLISHEPGDLYLTTQELHAEDLDDTCKIIEVPDDVEAGDRIWI